MDADYYRQKYQKYKQKYIEAKNQIGGLRRVPFSKFDDTIKLPAESVDTTQRGKFEKACLSTVPILCGTNTSQAGYCRKSEHLCLQHEFPDRDKTTPPTFGEKDLYGNPVFLYKPYIDLENIDALFPDNRDYPEEIKKIKIKTKEIIGELDKLSKLQPKISIARQEARENKRRHESGSVAPLIGVSAPPDLPRAPPLPLAPPPSLPPVPAKKTPTPIDENETTIRVQDLKTEMLELTTKIDMLIKKHDAQLLSMRNQLNSANMTSEKLGKTVNQLIPLVAQIVIAFAALKNMNSVMYRHGFSSIM